MGRVQIMALSIGISVCVLLYFAPTAPASFGDIDTTPDSEMNSYDLIQDVTEARNTLDANSLAQIDRFDELSSSSNNPDIATAALDSIATYFDTARKPDAAAFFLHKKALRTDAISDWTAAAERYLILAKYMGTAEQKPAWYKASASYYRKAHELDPDNIGLQIDLGVSIVEGSAITGEQPMEGIGLLKNAIELDPNNAKGHFYLGYFAEQSGQLEKAVERYSKVLELTPENMETHLYLAQAFEKMEDIESATAHLISFRESLNDPSKIADVNRQIEQLKN